MQTILFIALEFPPLGGAGVQRSLKFVKYLKTFGINPIVITAQEKDYESIMPGKPMDYSFLNDLSEDTIIERISCHDYKSGKRNKLQEWIKIYFSLIENLGKLWEKNLMEQLPSIAKKYNCKAIYVSIPPFAMAPLAVKISKHLTLPLLIDFRDAWSQWCVSPYGSIIHYKMLLQIERNCLMKAKAIIATSEQTKIDLIKIHNLPILSDKIEIIYNGFDSPIENINDKISIDNFGSIKIGYVGSFYYTPYARNLVFKKWYEKKVHQILQFTPRKEDWLYRSPYYFFRSVRNLLNLYPELKNKLTIDFAGNTPQWLIEQINEFKLGDIITHHGYLNHDKILAFQNKCDLLLITSSKVIGGKDYSIAGKTFEYFTMNKPILAFVTESNQRDILEKSGMAIVCDPDNLYTSTETLKKILTGKTKLFPNINFISTFHRKFITEKLSQKIKSIINV